MSLDTTWLVKVLGDGYSCALCKVYHSLIQLGAWDTPNQSHQRNGERVQPKRTQALMTLFWGRGCGPELSCPKGLLFVAQAGT